MPVISGLGSLKLTALDESEPLSAVNSPADDGGTGGILETIIQRLQWVRAAAPAEGQPYQVVGECRILG